MKNIILLILTCCTVYSVQSQSIAYYQLKHWTKSKNIVSIIGGTEIIWEKKQDFIALEYPITKKLDIALSYWDLSTWTQVHLRNFNAPIGFHRAGHATSRIRQRRFGVGLAYPLLNFHNIVELKVASRLEYEKSYSSELPSIVGGFSEDQIEGYRGTISTITFPGSQLLPTIGFRIDLNLIWKFSFHLAYDWTFGHRPFQNMFVEYTFYGVEQPTAEWFSDGTMHIKMIGVSYKLWGPKIQPSKKMTFF